MKRTGIIGIICPIPNEIIRRAIKDNLNIFVKNPVHSTLPLYLSKGSKILFYVGKPDRTIFAEGTISNIKLGDYLSIHKKRRIMQTKEELFEYCGSQFMDGTEHKLIYTIENLKVLPKNIHPKFSITMTGRYISQEEYLTLIN